MSNTNSPNQSRNRAVAALNSLLTQVSAITLKDIGLGWPVAGSEVPGREIDILAHVDIFGRTHTLACQISSGSGSHHVRATLDQLLSSIDHLPGKATPVLILPVLSPEVQSLCDQNNAACLDLHGNGRLAIDEIFVSMRTLPRRAWRQPVPASAPASLRSPLPAAEQNSTQRVLQGFSAGRAAMPDRASHPVRHARSH